MAEKVQGIGPGPVCFFWLKTGIALAHLKRDFFSKVNHGWSKNHGRSLAVRDKRRRSPGSLRSIDPLFKDTFDEMNSGVFRSRDLVGRRFLIPCSARWLSTVDVFERGDSLVVKADLPGLEKEDIEVAVEHGYLVIPGERKEEGTVEEETYYRMERAMGSFARLMHLPGQVQAENMKAAYKNGAFEVLGPKPSEAQEKGQNPFRITSPQAGRSASPGCKTLRLPP